MKPTPLWVLISLFMLCVLAVPTRAEIGVSTLGMDIELAPGESFNGSILVTNNSDQPATVQISLRDFEWDIDGNVQILPAGTLSRSLAHYITFFPAEFTLPARKGMAQPVRVIVSLPQQVSGPHWAMLSIRQVTTDQEEPPPMQDDERVVQATIGLSFGVQIRQVDPTRIVRDGRITDAQVLLPEGNQPLRVNTEFENIGTTFLRVTGEVRFINARGEIVTRVGIAPFRVLPGGKRRVEAPLLQPLPSGDYIALAVLDFGGDFLVAGQVYFRIP